MGINVKFVFLFGAIMLKLEKQVLDILRKRSPRPYLTLFHSTGEINPYWKRDTKTNCWVWIRSVKHFPSGDYGAIRDSLGKRTTRAHSLIYQIVFGPIPKGLELDHKCKNTLCVNPLHLEPVTHKVNLLRGNSPAAINYRKKNCIRGHNNWMIRPNGDRLCKTCNDEASRLWYINNRKKRDK